MREPRAVASFGSGFEGFSALSSLLEVLLLLSDGRGSFYLLIGATF